MRVRPDADESPAIGLQIEFETIEGDDERMPMRTRLSGLHRSFERANEGTHFVNESAILPMFSNTTDNRTPDDDAIRSLSNPRGILRRGDPESHGNGCLGVLSNLGDVVSHARHVVQFSPSDACDGNIIDKSAGLLLHVGPA